MTGDASTPSSPRQPVAAQRLPDDVEEFLEHLEKERDLSPNTLVAYRRDLASLCAWLGRERGVAGWTWEALTGRICAAGWRTSSAPGSRSAPWHAAFPPCAPSTAGCTATSAWT